jgi:hypothetical protein
MHQPVLVKEVSKRTVAMLGGKSGYLVTFV